MGLFDDVRCLYPLPWPEAQGGWFQSQYTPAQYLEKYELRENGELWYCDRKREWKEDGHGDLGGCFVTVSQQWVQEKFTGEIEIHAYHSVDGINYWYSVQFWFRDGVVKDAVFDKHQASGQASEVDPWPPAKPEAV
jgi:hypothetical protein